MSSFSRIPYGRQTVTQEDIDAVVETLRSDFLTQGPKIAEFEEAFAAYVGAKYAVAVANGTAALHLAALALGVGGKSRVLTTPITFVASANCVLYCGGSVDFVDVDPESALLDLDALEIKLKKSPGLYAGVIPVDFAGLPVDLEKLRSIADRHGLWILEDACHAPGATFRSKAGTWEKCGSGKWADISIFSFHPVKHIASGEGGMITTNNRALYDKVSLLRTHGITRDTASYQNRDMAGEGAWYYEMQELGFNYRMPDILAALGLSQLRRAEEGLARRRAIARRYDSAFANSSAAPMIPTESELHAYHLYIVRVENRRAVYDRLREKGILAQVHYVPVHLQPFYRRLGFGPGDFPAAEQFYSSAISLPMFPGLSDSDVDRVIASVLESVE